MSDFINSLCESRLFSSKRAVERYTARQVADILHLYISALAILRMSPATEKWAMEYARHTTRHNSITKWRNDATDLEILIVALMDESVVMRMPDASAKLREKITLDEKMLVRWLKDVASPVLDTDLTRRLFTRLDTGLRITDSSMKAIRRLAQDWGDLDAEEASLAMTRLLQMLRHEAPKSEILVPLETLAKTYSLELKNVCNPETGDGCEHEVEAKAAQDEKPKKKSFLASLTGLVVGGAIGYTAGKKFNEDATAGDTSVADIAPVVGSALPVQRRWSTEFPSSEAEKSRKKPK